MKAVAAIAMLMTGFSFCYKQDTKDNSVLFTELLAFVFTIMTFIMM